MNSMEQNSSWEANRSIAMQEISNLLWSPKVHYHIHKSPPSSWARSVLPMPPHPTTCLRSILILSSYLCLGLSSGHLPSGLPTKIPYAPLLSPTSATWPVYLIFLDLIAWRIMGRSTDQKASRLLDCPVSSSLLGLNTFLSTLFLNTLSLCFALNVRDQVSHMPETMGKIIFLYVLVFILSDTQLEEKDSIFIIFIKKDSLYKKFIHDGKLYME